VVEAGGAVSHHHGIGKVRSAFNKQLYDEPSLAMVKAVKKAIDPQDVFCARNNALKQ
jgi:alkyldihydroxyacetonephosphate synthase